MTSSRPHATPTTPPWIFHSTKNKKISCKSCTQFDFLPLEFLRNIDMCHEVLVHHNQLKPVLLRLIQHHPVLCASTAYGLKYVPFDYFTHYYHINYPWADRHKVPHNSLLKWGKEKIIKHDSIQRHMTIQDKLSQSTSHLYSR